MKVFTVVLVGLQDTIFLYLFECWNCLCHMYLKACLNIHLSLTRKYIRLVAKTKDRTSYRELTLLLQLLLILIWALNLVYYLHNKTLCMTVIKLTWKVMKIYNPVELDSTFCKSSRPLWRRSLKFKISQTLHPLKVKWLQIFCIRKYIQIFK